MTTKNDYTELDTAILQSLAERPKKFATLKRETYINQAAQKFVTGAYKPDWRFVDARLQSLRKAGRVEFLGARHGWALKVHS